MKTEDALRCPFFTYKGCIWCGGFVEIGQKICESCKKKAEKYEEPPKKVPKTVY